MPSAVTLDGESLQIPNGSEAGWHIPLNRLLRAILTRLGLAPKVINVKAYGAIGDGVTDDTAAIQAAINAAPSRVYGWSTSINRPKNAAVIYFPTGTSSAAKYRVTSRIDIPGDKNLRFTSDASHSACIAMDNAAVNYIFRVVGGDGQRPMMFENLIFHKGGIEYETGNRRFHAIRNCAFQGCPEWAVRTVGESVIDVEISRCQFSENVGGVNIQYEQADTWVISHCVFVRNSGVHLKIQTSGVHVVDCDFEVHSGSAGTPFVQICNDPDGVRPGNDVVFSRCRFGNETNPPRECVVIGPIGSVSTSSTGAIWFDKCLFRGANGQTPTADQGKSAFLINQAASGLRITDCEFFTYTNIIEEGYASSSAASALVGPNLWRGIIPGDTKLFTAGGIGWYTDLPMPFDNADYGVWKGGRASPYRGGYNLLPRTNVAMANGNWLQSNATLTRDQTGPDGAANSAYRMSRTAGGSSASVRCQTSSTDPVTGAITFIVSLKKGTDGFAHARLGIIDGSNVWRCELIDVLLTDEWLDYHVTAYGLSNQQVTCQLYCGWAGDTTIGQEICFAEPAAFKGSTPLPRVRNSADSATAIHAPAQWQGLVLGHRTIGYGTAAPAAGRYEVGDIVFDTAPTANGTMGWVCVTAGAPGTWKTWGAIAA